MVGSGPLMAFATAVTFLADDCLRVEEHGLSTRSVDCLGAAVLTGDFLLLLEGVPLLAGDLLVAAVFLLGVWRVFLVGAIVE